MIKFNSYVYARFCGSTLWNRDTRQDRQRVGA
jgi:hypothetical protein